MPVLYENVYLFSWYEYQIVGLVFSHLGFWSGSLFLVAPFPDLCLLVLLYENVFYYCLTLPNGIIILFEKVALIK